MKASYSGAIYAYQILIAAGARDTDANAVSYINIILLAWANCT